MKVQAERVSPAMGMRAFKRRCSDQLKAVALVTAVALYWMLSAEAKVELMINPEVQVTQCPHVNVHSQAYWTFEAPAGGEDMYTGTGMVRLPMSPGEAVFVALDLTRWQSFPSVFEIAHPFDLSSGINDVLPGMSVAPSPVTYNAMKHALATTSPAAGQLVSAGLLERQQEPVPEPVTIALLGLGLVLIFAMRYRRR